MPHDVTVVGAGIFGLSVAYCCARRGANVRVVDLRGVGAGSSGGIVGALAPHTPENWNDKKAFQFESLRMSETFWTEVSHRSGIDPGYGRMGRIQPLLDEASVALAKTRAVQAATLWQGFAKWDVTAAAEFDALPVDSATGLVVHDTLSARINPARACEALARAIVSLGGDVSIGESVADGEEADRLVWATGYEGLVELKNRAGRALGNGVKGQAALLEFSAPCAPQLFVESLHLVPHADGTLAVGSTSERDFEDPTGLDEQLENIVERAREVCRCLRDAPVIGRWAGVRPRARSRAPILGAHPNRQGQFVANGGFKIGFGMAPKVGEVMADLVLDGDSSGIPEPFRPEASF